ncbi:MAG: GNAT family N-acetyltransferase [Actinomycetes bacterium]
MQIRPAEPDELEAVGELTVAAYVADGYVSADEPYASELRAADERASQADLVVAVDADDTLLGTVTFCLPESPWAEISRSGEAEFRMLAVAAQARGRGVGAALTQWCVDHAREQGCTAVALSSLGTMYAAHRIYERMGFVRAPDRDWWPAPDTQLIAYLLELA